MRVAFLASVAAGNSGITKVVEMLGGMKSKVEADLENEEKLMEEFNTWCAVEDQKLKDAITQDEKTIKKSKATIEDESAKIEEYASQISELGAAIAAKQDELKEAEGVQKDEQKMHADKEAELVDAVRMLKMAYSVIKKATSGGLSFAQGAQTKMNEVVSALQAIINAAGIDTAKKAKLQSFLEADDGLTLNLHQPQASTSSYDSHSGGILEVIEGMQDETEADLQKTREEATKSRHAYELFTQAATDEIANNTKALGDAKKHKANSEEGKGSATKELKATQESLAADQSEHETTLKECADKAEAWATRQTEAAGEIEALQQASDILSNGVTVLAQVATSTKRMKAADETRARVVSLLRRLGHKYNSFGFLQAATVASADPFGKVRALINDMIAKLEKQAQEEASHEEMCKTELAKATKSKAEKEAELDKYTTRLDKATAKIASLTEAIKLLRQELGENAESVASATELRNKEKAANEGTIKDNSESAAAVSQAIKVLRDFYAGGESFLQAKQPSFGTSQSAGAAPIIGILETAEGDFSKLAMETEQSEAEAADDYEKFMQASEVSKAKKEAEVTGKEGEIESLKVSQNQLSEDISSVETEMDSVLKTLSTLKKQCANKSMSYEERKERREAEIAGLQEALEILTPEEDAALIQTKTFLAKH